MYGQQTGGGTPKSEPVLGGYCRFCDGVRPAAVPSVGETTPPLLCAICETEITPPIVAIRYLPPALAPLNAAPAEDTPAEDTPAEAAPAEAAPAEDAAARDTPATRLKP